MHVCKGGYVVAKTNYIPSLPSKNKKKLLNQFISPNCSYYIHFLKKKIKTHKLLIKFISNLKIKMTSHFVSFLLQLDITCMCMCMYNLNNNILVN